MPLWATFFLEGIWSCRGLLSLPWRTFPSILLHMELLLMLCCVPWTFCSGLLKTEVPCLVLTLAVCLLLSHFTRSETLSLWMSNFWEGMWSCQAILRSAWRTLPSSTVSQYYTVWTVWRVNDRIWEGICIVLLPITLILKLAFFGCYHLANIGHSHCTRCERLSLWKSYFWEGMWSCQVILRSAWCTLPPLTEIKGSVWTV